MPFIITYCFIVNAYSSIILYKVSYTNEVFKIEAHSLVRRVENSSVCPICDQYENLQNQKFHFFFESSDLIMFSCIWYEKQLK